MHGCVNGFTGVDCDTGEGMLLFSIKLSHFTTVLFFVKVKVTACIFMLLS